MIRAEMLESNAAAVGSHDCWLAAPLRRGPETFGLLLAACPDHARHQRNRLVLQQLAEETAVAVENAQLFGRVRELSIDEERRRLAREIHDGIAQALMHVRLELDFIAKHATIPDPAVTQEFVRLARVVDRAVSDVRSVILGLRSSVSTEGLAGSLRSYIRDLRGLGGPEITLVTRGRIELAREAEAEMFRIAQEALSNALRHADATGVAVTIESSSGRVRLIVEDDGKGFDQELLQDAGVGLKAMQERAEMIGAALEIASQPGRGTSVAVTYSPSEHRQDEVPARLAIGMGLA